MKSSVIIFLFLIIVWYVASINQENIKNCMKLRIGDTQADVLRAMGKPSNIFRNGESLQYHPTRAFSSCQVVLTFEESKNGELELTKKFCDDGVIYTCG